MCPLFRGSTVHKEEDNLSIVDKVAGPNVSFIGRFHYIIIFGQTFLKIVWTYIQASMDPTDEVSCCTCTSNTTPIVPFPPLLPPPTHTHTCSIYTSYPSPASMVSRVCYKVADILNSANEEQKDSEDGEGPISVMILSDYGMSPAISAVGQLHD